MHLLTSQTIRDATWAFLDSLDLSPDLPTVLITHIPLYKPEGMCVDGPYFEYYAHGDLAVQNHLSSQASAAVLQKLPLRRSAIITGHDHEGCSTRHMLRGGSWTVGPGASAGPADGGDVSISEYTLRSVMGQYGGHFFTLRITDTVGEGTAFQLDDCPAIGNTLWWSIHVGIVLEAAATLAKIAGLV